VTVSDPQSGQGQQIHFAGAVSGGNFQFVSAQDARGNINVNHGGADGQSLAAALKHLDALRNALRVSTTTSPDESAHALNATTVIDDELRKRTPDKARVSKAIGVLRDSALSLTGLASALAGLESAVTSIFHSR
jgi:hypothetical protein